MHPAAHRALAELVGACRHLCEHWSTLAGRLAGPEAVVLRAGADSSAELLTGLVECAHRLDLHDQGTGQALDGIRGRLADRFLARNEALRTAVLDVQHVTTLLAYTEAVARADEDGRELADFCARWQERLWAHENVARGLAIASADDPDQAIAPADGTPVRA